MTYPKRVLIAIEMTGSQSKDATIQTLAANK